jgi:hypothetical protein
MELSREQLDDLRLGALTAIDGLWFLEMEKLYGFDTALKIDLEVWKNYGVILMKRLGKMTGIRPVPGGTDEFTQIKFLLEVLCRVDGTECAGEVRGGDTLEFNVFKCSWWENLKRAGREKVVPCEMIDDTIFGHWLRTVDPEIRMEITRSLPRGDDHCSFCIRRGGAQK